MKNNLKIVSSYRDNEILRNEFHNYIANVFPGISFKEWNARGFWTENYIPFSILESGKIISSASASIMTVIVNGKTRRAVQIGAVGTLPEYRNRGLSRRIMNHLIEHYKEKTDLFFLHANDTVLDFYPKFGFRTIDENVFVTESAIPEPEFSARKLNIEVEADNSLLQNLLDNRRILTRIFGAENYGFITMWHVFNIYRDNLYYLENENAIVIKEEKNNTLHIIDVLYRSPLDIQSALPKVMESDSINTIRYYFPPDQLVYSYDKSLKENTGLFVLGDFKTGNNPFRFPETAVT